MRGFGNCVLPLPWRATGARTETRRRRGICLLRFMAGSRKGWTLPICSERDCCWSGSIEIAPALYWEERKGSGLRPAHDSSGTQGTPSPSHARTMFLVGTGTPERARRGIPGDADRLGADRTVGAGRLYGHARGTGDQRLDASLSIEPCACPSLHLLPLCCPAPPTPCLAARDGSSSPSGTAFERWCFATATRSCCRAATKSP